MDLNNTKNINLKQWLFTALTCTLFASIVVAEKAQAVLSICMGLQLASIIFLTKPAEFIRNYIKDRTMLWFSVSYLFLIFSFIYSSNTHYLLERLQIKLPFLLYALVWPSIGILSTQQIRVIIWGYLSVITLTVVGILANYALHFDAVNQMYLESKIMPGPISHIRFSLLVVFGIYLAYYFIKKELSFKPSVERNILFGVAIFLCIFLHIYSVRSGILTLYAMMALVLANHVWQSKNIKHLMVATTIIGCIGIGSFLLSPTMRNKLINTQQDVGVYQQDKDPNYNSLATRMVSYQTALAIFKENIWIGCGQGDLKDKNDELFRTNYPTIITPILPHNQFILYLAATGIIGLFLFTIGFTAPLWRKGGYKIEVIQVGFVILLIAFQFEPMIETQIGVICTLLFVLLPLQLNKQQSIKA